ncbi:TolC family outer membrane protein [Seohaeicola zhoushanensis]|uniref:Transporter n=1 Tax=Seohaeicola zhoushanensis TaxID=1569283 RepID=A0A8J3MBR2_9RHOB|nr:TolC family outer membrane protein [Seohaeicola zhoushanensis]GHF67636.1 transporter [Seohaeicola zhoushanensis]
MGMLGAGKRLRRGLVAAAAAVILAAPAARADNLADALISAYNTSGLLEQNRALLRAIDEDYALSVSALRPIIDYTVSMGRSYSGSGTNNATSLSRGSTALTARLSLSWTILDAGERFYGIEQARETVLATRQDLLAIEQQVLFRATAAYVNVLLQNDNVALQRNNLRVLGEELRAAQDRFDVGEVTRTDVALAEARVAAARSNLSTAQGQLMTAQAEYQAVIGRRALNLHGQPRLPAMPKSLEAAVQLAVRTHPSVLAAQHKVKAAEHAVAVANSKLRPSLSIVADTSYSDDMTSSDFDKSASVGLQLKQRIYQGGGIAASVRRVMASRDATRGALITTQRDVVQGVNDAYVRLQVARAAFAASIEQVRASQVAFDGIREEATLGARTTLDVLAAEQELQNAQTAQISARAEESVAAYQLLAAQGLLTAEKLGLKVALYDPEAYYNMVKKAPAAVSRQGKELDRVLKRLGKE